jgi:hypothetical protein
MTTRACTLSLVLLSTLGHAVDLNEWAFELGYRRDHASFGVVATLSDPAYNGFGLSRYRGLQIAEIGFQAEAGLTPRFLLRGEVKAGAVLTGKLEDSGVADISSDPFNAHTADFYGLCQAPCDDSGCRCLCPDLLQSNLVPTSAHVKGFVWDINLALGAVFRPDPSWSVVPLVGWQWNAQNYRWTHSSWGPLETSSLGSPCSTPNPAFSGLLAISPCNEGLLECLTDGSNLPLGCLSFADCFNSSRYKAQWNTAEIGLEVNWAVCEQWHLSALYAFHFGAYYGRFETLGGECCECDPCSACPQFYDVCGSSLSAPQVIGFVPSSMRVHAPAVGQEVILAADWGGISSWHLGLQASFQTRRVSSSCPDIEPCESCGEVCNAARQDGASKLTPVWQDAVLERARWGTFDILLTIGKVF